ncbi:MAG TPA: glycoside hydrolase family 3 N-terminal domain-containing protein, partial [Deinococcales bacterium]|nr:glycoside hydrolase family 3 N-terminal domain-containing protein [Deinococcales bacterium]
AAAAAGRALLRVGINVDFAPNADVNVNPRNPVIAERSFSADPAEAARHVAAFVGGLQEAGVAATAKHFPGHGDTQLDSHLALPVLERTREEFRRLELPPFRAAVAAGTAGIMTAHIVFSHLDPDLPATLSGKVLGPVLRGELGFDGVIFTDALDMRAITEHHPPVRANIMALSAGVDAPLNIGSVQHHADIADGVDAAVAAGELDPELLHAARTRLQRLAERFPAGVPDPAARDPDGEEVLREAARRGTVLRGALPRFSKERPVTVVYQVRTMAHDATQQIVNPGEDFARLLKERGYRVVKISFLPGRLQDERAVRDILERVQPDSTVMYASSGRELPAAEEVGLVRELARRHPADFLHLAFWNPYHSLELPGPALITFGFRQLQLEAALAVLEGEPAPGTLPF